MSKKKIIRLTEGDLHQMIKDVVLECTTCGSVGGGIGLSDGSNPTPDGNSYGYDVPLGGGVQQKDIYGGPVKPKNTISNNDPSKKRNTTKGISCERQK